MPKARPFLPATTASPLPSTRSRTVEAPVWMGTQNVTTDAGGNYSVLLGSTTAAGLPPICSRKKSNDSSGCKCRDSPNSRVLLVSVPYALKAHEANPGR